MGRLIVRIDDKMADPVIVMMASLRSLGQALETTYAMVIEGEDGALAAIKSLLDGRVIQEVEVVERVVEKVLFRGQPVDKRPCSFCGEIFQPRKDDQICCGKVECRKKQKAAWQARYLEKKGQQAAAPVEQAADAVPAVIEQAAALHPNCRCTVLPVVEQAVAAQSGTAEKKARRVPTVWTLADGRVMSNRELSEALRWGSLCVGEVVRDQSGVQMRVVEKKGTHYQKLATVRRGEG